MNVIEITGPTGKLSGSLSLPGSKSISNRVLIIRALSQKRFEINNLSTGSDTAILNDILCSERDNYYVGHGGTTLRFATAYFAVQPGTQRLIGTERLNKRPISELVNALNEIGARIEYGKDKNQLPIIIHPFEGQKKDIITLDASISSQFISALCLVAPSLPMGMKIELDSKIVSSPYIEMTIRIMKEFGVTSSWDTNVIRINSQEYQAKEYTVESDWSAAGYYYALASAYEKCELSLSKFTGESLQGDQVINEWGRKYGIETNIDDGTIHLSRSKKKSGKVSLDFIKYPDLVQTMTVMSMMAGHPLICSGLDTLPGKETDRITALKSELKKFGVNFLKLDTFKYELSGTFHPSGHLVNTYDDHRMAMAFAVLAAKGPVRIENPGVVFKSYPGFWKDLTELGFRISIL